MRVCERVLQAAAQYGDVDAFVFRDAATTYRELSAGILRTAAGLKAAGLKAGDRAALLLPNCPPFLLAYYGATLIDAVVVPANPLLKPPELAYMWADAEIALVFTVPQLLPAVNAVRASVPGLKCVVCAGSPQEIQAVCDPASVAGLRTLDDLLASGKAMLDADASCLDMPPSDDDRCAVIIYTSGTTGHPKGAMLSHRNLTSNVNQACQALEIKQDDVFLTVLPLFHSFAGTVCMNIPLMLGCRVALLESFQPAKVLEVVEKYGVSIFAGVPAMYQALLMHKPDRGYDLSALRMMISGGAPLPASTLAAVEERFHVPVIEGDGPTECSPATSINPLHGVRKAGSVGIPLPGVEIAIFDDSDRALGTDEIGEIVVRGDNVMLGYLNQPEATAEAMTGGWYHTGDLGRIDSDGYVFIVDRKKDMVITAGLNVYPREIEEVLYGHPAVQECAVIGLPNALRGEEVVAVVVKRSGADLTERDVVAHCRERLANYKLPRRVLFLESLPRGATGKVVKRLLKKELEMQSI